MAKGVLCLAGGTWRGGVLSNEAAGLVGAGWPEPPWPVRRIWPRPKFLQKTPQSDRDLGIYIDPYRDPNILYIDPYHGLGTYIKPSNSDCDY
jgi:hypothetical protein